MHNDIKKVDTATKLLWLYVLMSALYIMEWPSIQFGVFNTAFMATAGQTFAEVLLIPLAVLATPNKYLKSFFTIMMTIEICLVWFKGNGIMLAPSFDMALIALYLPFAPMWLIACSLVTICTHHASTAILIIIAQLVAVGIKNRKFRIALIAIIPILVSIAAFHSGHLFDGSERLQAYQRFMEFWWQPFNQVPYAFHSPLIKRIFGYGPGAFIWLSMMIDNYKDPVFMQMHSDWLQITFELGLCGLGLTIIAVSMAVKRVWNDQRVMSAVFGCMAISITYHGLRFAPSMLLMAFIFKETLPKKTA